jgi:hypothetical protein
MDFDVEADSKVPDLKQVIPCLSSLVLSLSPLTHFLSPPPQRLFDYFVQEGKITDPSNVTPKHIRLRLKTRNTVSTILSHELTLRQNQVSLFSGRELAVEILDHEELYTSLPFGDVIIYLQKWNRQDWTVTPPIEVILRGDMTIYEITQYLAHLTSIPLDNLRLLLLQPYNEVKFCDLHLPQPVMQKSWLNLTSAMNKTRRLSEMQWYLRDWDTLLVQDCQEPLKKLSKNEIRTVKEAKAYQSNYGYDYYYDTTTPTSGTSITVGSTSTATNTKRVEKGMYHCCVCSLSDAV